MKIEDIAVSDQKLFFIPRGLALIIEYDCMKHTAKMVVRMSQNNILNDECGIIQSVDGYLYIAPILGNLFWVINREHNQIAFSKKFRYEKKLFNKDKFRGKFVCDKYVGFIGYGFPGIAVFERETNHLIIKEIDLSPLEDAVEKFTTSQKIFGTNYAIVDNYLNIPFYGTKHLLVLNLNNLEYEIKTDYFLYDLIGICGDGSRQIWLIPMVESKLIKYDMDGKEVLEEIDMLQGYNGGGKSCYMSVFCHGKNIWILSSAVNVIIKIEKNTYKTVYIKRSEDIDLEKNICAGLLNDRYIWEISWGENFFDLIDTTMNSIEKLSICGIDMPNEIMEEFLSKTSCSEPDIKLEQFIQFVEIKDAKNDVGDKTTNHGNKI